MLDDLPSMLALNFSFNNEYIQVLIFRIFKYAYKDFILKF